MTLPVAIRDTDVMSSRVYQFCGFELNAATRELRYPDGRTLVLPVRVFDCVSHLIEHRDRAVGRDELIVVVWNRSDIKDNMLAQLVTRTRRLLEDTGEVQRIIRTVTGYGYHWIARTAVCAPSDAADTSIARTSSDAEKAGLAAAGATPQSRSSTLGRTARTVAVVCAIGLLAFVGWRSMTGPSEARVAARAPLPAQTLPTLVLPAVVTPVGSQEWLRIGVMAMVAERLQLAGQAVIKPESSVALTQGADVAAMRESDFSRLADLASANAVVLAHVSEVESGWQVRLEQVHGEGVMRLAVDAVASHPTDAASQATDRLLVALGFPASPASSGVDRQLMLTMKQVQAALIGGRTDAARELLTLARDAFPESSEWAYQLARIEAMEGDLDSAQASLASVLSETSVHDDPVAAARAKNLLGIVCYKKGDPDCVKRHSQGAIDLLIDSEGAADELGRSYFVRSMATFATGEWEASLDDLARARMLWTASGDRLGIARIDSNRGIIYRQRARTHEAVALLENAANQLQAFHSVSDEAMARSNLVLALLDEGRPVDAIRHEPRLRELAELGRRYGLGAGLDLIRANLLIRNGRMTDASRIVEALHVLDEGESSPPASAEAYSVAAIDALARERFDFAERVTSDAIALDSNKRCNPRGMAKQYLTLARLRARHDPDGAASLSDRLIEVLPHEGRDQARLYAHLIDANVAVARNEPRAVQTALDAAYALAQSSSAPYDRLAVAETFVPWLLANDDLVQATRLVGSLGGMAQQNFEAAVLELRLYRDTGPWQAWLGAYDRAVALAGERAVPADLRPRSGQIPLTMR